MSFSFLYNRQHQHRKGSERENILLLASANRMSKDEAFFTHDSLLLFSCNITRSLSLKHVNCHLCFAAAACDAERNVMDDAALERNWKIC